MIFLIMHLNQDKLGLLEDIYNIFRDIGSCFRSVKEIGSIIWDITHKIWSSLDTLQGMHDAIIMFANTFFYSLLGLHSLCFHQSQKSTPKLFVPFFFINHPTNPKIIWSTIYALSICILPFVPTLTLLLPYFLHLSPQ